MSDDPNNQARLAWIKALAKSMEGLSDDELRERTKTMREYLIENRKKRESN